MKRWSRRFFSSTRGQVIKLLRQGEATVSDLAEALDLTDNAIRSHLTKLERDELVYPSGKRPGVRKPETLYALTPEAEQLFPKAYHLLFNTLLEALHTRLPSAEVEQLLREVGRSLAEDLPTSGEGRSIRSRSEVAVEVLEDLGGLAELQESEDQFVIRGYSCPLAAAVKEHPEVCQLAEALLAGIIGRPVHEMCDRNGEVRCAFLVRPESA